MMCYTTICSSREPNAVDVGLNAIQAFRDARHRDGKFHIRDLIRLVRPIRRRELSIVGCAPRRQPVVSGFRALDWPSLEIVCLPSASIIRNRAQFPTLRHQPQ